MLDSLGAFIQKINLLQIDFIFLKIHVIMTCLAFINKKPSRSIASERFNVKLRWIKINLLRKRNGFSLF